MSKNATYKYIKEKSIINGECDAYSLTEYEFYCLYSFYVTYSMCEGQSAKNRSFSDYGWPGNSIEQTVDHKKVQTKLGIALYNALDLKNSKFYFLTSKDNNLTDLFKKYDLLDGPLSDCDTERAVINKKTRNNKYITLFYTIRNGLAHGNFVLKYSSKMEKMVIFQDNDCNNVSARIVIKLSTLLSLIEAVDINGIIINRPHQNSRKRETVA